MKLSEWARRNGVCYKTARRWFASGQLPVPAKKMDTGTVLVLCPNEIESKVACIYARVSSHDQKEDLDRQVERLISFCTARGFVIRSIVREIGSGLNGNRAKLIKLLSDPTISVLVVENRDRLVRFGFCYLESCMKASGRSIVVSCEEERRDDLVQDFVDLATSMCAKIYGKRSAANRAKRAVEAASENHS